MTLDGIRVDLLVGDIYESKDIPDPLSSIAEVVGYGNTGDLSTLVYLSSQRSVEVTALSIHNFEEIVRKCMGRMTRRSSMEQDEVHFEAVKTAMNDPASPASRVIQRNPQVLVVGQTPLFEEVVQLVSRIKTGAFGPLIVRFSSFYGDRSVHTGKSAGEVGYNLDMPKDLFLLYDLLMCTEFLDAISKKDLNELVCALNQFNDNSGKEPVLVI